MQINDLLAKLDASQRLYQSTLEHHAATLAQFTQTIEDKDHKIELLERRLKRLLTTVRGSRQEYINPDQLVLFSHEELMEMVKESEETTAPSDNNSDEPQSDDEEPKSKDQPKAKGRRKLPTHLPREVLRHELSEEQRRCPCCGELRIEFGIETSEQLDYVPASWKVIEHQRVKYTCQGCQEHVTVAPKPPQPIEKGRAGARLSSLHGFGEVR